MPTPRPTRPATGMAEAETSIEPARRVMPPIPAPTATSARPIGSTAATTVPNTTSRTSSATSRPMAAWPRVSSSALRNTASPPSSTRTPGTWMPETASESTVKAGLPISRSGTSRVTWAYPIRPSCGDGAGRERVGDRRDVVEPGDVGQHRLDVRRCVFEGRAVLGLEDDQGGALGRLGEVLVEQLPWRGRSGCPGRRSRRRRCRRRCGEEAARRPGRTPSSPWCATGASRWPWRWPRVNLFMVVPFGIVGGIR